MALSKKRATTGALVRFVQYAMANGVKVTDMPPYDAVTPGSHERGSWHYLKDGKYGQAADLNTRLGSSTAERNQLALFIPVAQSFGLAIIFGYYGTNGPAAQHRDHMHVDVGSYSNLGRGGFVPALGSTVVADTQLAVHQPLKRRDNLLGRNTWLDVDAVRMASRFHHNQFPHTLARARAAVGAGPGASWDLKARQCHDATVGALQTRWKAAGLYKGTVDHVWGPLMDQACAAWLRKYRRF
jgi:hypothetical protein